MWTIRGALPLATVVLACTFLQNRVMAFVPTSFRRHAAPLFSTHFTKDQYAEDMFYHDKKIDFSDGAPDVNMEKMVKCAESKVDCTTEEIETMIQDLERLNHDCDHLLSEATECDVEKIEGRNVLKQALTLKRDLNLVNERMRGIRSLNTWRKKSSANGRSQSNGVQEHSFSHYVDYRDIGEYESH